MCDSINNVNLWHNKLGHPNFVVFSKLYKTITGKSCSTSLDFCDACKRGKSHQIAHSSVDVKTTQAFQLVHADLWGPTTHASPQGFKYYLSFVDDFTRYTWIYPLVVKSEASSIVKNFIIMINCHFQSTITRFQSD